MTRGLKQKHEPWQNREKKLYKQPKLTVELNRSEQMEDKNKLTIYN